MPTSVIMPKLGMTQEEGTVIQWLKKEGERVEKGEPLLEVMTDKVNMEVEAPATGILRNITAGPDTTVPVTTIIAYIAGADEALPAAGMPPATPAAPPPAAGEERIAASPLARRLAREGGLDLATVRGSGPRGRIVEGDVRAALEASKQAAPSPAPVPVAPPVAPAAALPSTRLVPLSGRRKVMAERMAACAQIPQYALGVDADMTQAEQARRGCSVTAFLIRVAAHALKRHPLVNASFQPDGIALHGEINVGVAVSADEGLVVPVIKDAGTKDLATLDQELKDMAARARSAKLTPDDVTGATFTVSNLGMAGIEEFTALLNPPGAAILAAGRIVRKPVVLGESIVARPILHLTLTADHRVLDGATAAAFLMEVKGLIENPYGLL